MRPLTGEQRLRQIRTKVRLVAERHWRDKGWGLCTGDLERDFILKEFDRLAGKLLGRYEVGTLGTLSPLRAVGELDK